MARGRVEARVVRLVHERRTRDEAVVAGRIRQRRAEAAILDLEERRIGAVVAELALHVEPRERRVLDVHVAKKTIAAVIARRVRKLVDRVLVLRPLIERVRPDVHAAERILREQVGECRHTRQAEEARRAATFGAGLVQAVLREPAVERVQAHRPLLRKLLRHVQAHRVALQAIQAANRALLTGVRDRPEEVRAGILAGHIEVRRLEHAVRSHLVHGVVRGRPLIHLIQAGELALRQGRGNATVIPEGLRIEGERAAKLVDAQRFGVDIDLAHARLRVGTRRRDDGIRAAEQLARAISLQEMILCERHLVVDVATTDFRAEAEADDILAASLAGLGGDLDHAIAGACAVQRGTGRTFHDLDALDVK